jgi:hypothetical protein
VAEGASEKMTPRKGETPEEFRARLRARYAAADPEYRERLLARQRERYTTDPVYREQLLSRVSAKNRAAAAETLRQKMKGPSL